MYMRPQIQFIYNIQETTLPFIQMTKSKNGKTGTATFIFKNPSIFSNFQYPFQLIDGMYLLWEEKKIMSKDIKIFFVNGEPTFLRAIFIFKNANEWFNFLNFMTVYSKETGLLFSETN